jgi:limonene-1,2-epoxide hydrolase
MDHAATIRNYYAAWVRDDVDAVFALCSDDLVAGVMPNVQVKGKDAVRKFLDKLGRGMTNKRYDILHMTVSGDVAFVEGIESYVKDGKPVATPYVTVFEFAADGRIREWRDYFDMHTVLRQLGLPLDGSRPERASTATGVRSASQSAD